MAHEEIGPAAVVRRVSCRMAMAAFRLAAVSARSLSLSVVWGFTFQLVILRAFI